jgi:hypothetical protein
LSLPRWEEDEDQQAKVDFNDSKANRLVGEKPTSSNAVEGEERNQSQRKAETSFVELRRLVKTTIILSTSKEEERKKRKRTLFA